jgi:outer membrane protein TolC
MARTWRTLVRPSPTTIRRSTLALALCAASAAAEPLGETLSEVALIRAALHQPVVATTLDALRELTNARSTPAPWVANPSLEVRREQGNGPAGATTSAVGGTVVVDLGFGGVAEQRAASLRGEAGEAWQHAEIVTSICDARDLALALWAESERGKRVDQAHDRLRSVLAGLDALAGVGAAAGYDRDRLGLTVAIHQVEREAGARELAGARALASTRVGSRVSGVELMAPAAQSPLDGLVADALERDPVAMALRTERDALKLATAAARRAGAPDLTVSGGARWDALPDGRDQAPGYEIGISLELPIADRNQVAVAERRAERAEIEARLARREADLRAAVEVAFRQVESLGPAPEPPRSDAVWAGALARYAAGEASIDELLNVANDVEDAELSSVDAAAMRRRARLQLACAVGAFPEPEIQALLEESLR